MVSCATVLDLFIRLLHKKLVEAILGFHSTCVMNVITHRTAYCLFAKPTLLDKNSFTFNNSLTDVDSLPIRHKWMARGFNVVHCPSADDLVCFDSGITIRHYRWVGDSACLKMDLEHHDDFDESNESDPIESNSWGIRYQTTHTTIKLTFFQPDSEQPGIGVSREERRTLTRKYEMLKSSVDQQLKFVEYAMFSCQSSQPSRSIHWERNPVVGSIIRNIMRSVNYQPPYLSSSPLQAAALLQDLYDFLNRIHLDHKNVALKRVEIHEDTATHCLVVVTLWIDPVPRPINICVYNKFLLSFSSRGLNIQFVWPIGNRVKSVK
ncbi:hypothetical protein FB446DRAFT_490272 [Lentinula raphanica]|nr:hypothetical protein FB446DRAFT_490272 [Lentinula raphanica]